MQVITIETSFETFKQVTPNASKREYVMAMASAIETFIREHSDREMMDEYFWDIASAAAPIYIDNHHSNPDEIWEAISAAEQA